MRGGFSARGPAGLLALLVLTPIFAGGPNTVSFNGVAFKWDPALPINYSIDNGPLGTLSRDEAALLVQRAFQKWQDVATSSMRFLNLGFLPLDINAENFGSYFAEKRPENPVVFDSDGKIIESFLGQGASQTTLGFASVRHLDPETNRYVSARAVLNGLAARAENLDPLLLHEIGHMLGLDHTQAGHRLAENTELFDNALVPVMYPFSLAQATRQPLRDDVSWISWLYPESTFRSSTGTIAGRVFRANGLPLPGANVVAVRVQRRQDGAILEFPDDVVSVVSDFLLANNGSYELPGLPPGDYVVFIEPLDARFSGISSVGPYSERLTNFVRDYFNGVNESGKWSDDPLQKTILTVSPGQTVDKINLFANEESAGLPKVNQNPVSSAGPDQIISKRQTVVLSGAAYDPDGDPLSFGWSQLVGPTVALNGVNKLEARFATPILPAETDLFFRLTVSDGKGGIGTDDIKITIGRLKPPPFVFPVSLDTGDRFFKDTFVGVAILNPNGSTNEVSFSGGLRTPLAALGQRAFLASQIAAPVQGSVHLVAQGEHGPVQGFLMVGDTRLKRLDSVSGTLQESTVLYLPMVRQSATESTLVFLFNPNESSAVVTLTMFSTEGLPLQETNLTLRASGSYRGTLEQLFRSSSLVEEGYLAIVGNLRVQGFAVYAGESDLSSLAAQAPTQVRELVVPHFFVTRAGGNTEIRLLNAGNERAFVRMKAFDDASKLLGTAEFTIAPKKLFVNDLRELLNFESSPTQALDTVSGFLILEVTEGKMGIFQKPAAVVGSVTLRGGSASFRSTLPMSTSEQREVFFTRVTQSASSGLFTGLAILNASAEVAEVRVRAFDENGEKVAEVQLRVPRLHRAVDLLNGPSLFGTGFEVKGHIQVSSQVPVVAIGLMGDFNSRFLAAIEPQPPPQ